MPLLSFQVHRKSSIRNFRSRKVFLGSTKIPWTVPTSAWTRPSAGPALPRCSLPSVRSAPFERWKGSCAWRAGSGSGWGGGCRRSSGSRSSRSPSSYAGRKFRTALPRSWNIDIVNQHLFWSRFWKSWSITIVYFLPHIQKGSQLSLLTDSKNACARYLWPHRI